MNEQERSEAFRFKARVRFRHPSMDMGEITTALGLRPSRTWTAGTARTTPAGTVLDGEYRDGHWSSEAYSGSAEDFDEQLHSILHVLESRGAFVEALLASGGRAEILIAIFPGVWSGGPVIERRDLRRMAALGIALGFDVYGGSADEPGLG